MTYVIRSMSTTDYTPAYRRGNDLVPVQMPKPYHIYLKAADKRHSAYWAPYGDIAHFETAEEAQAEAERINLNGYDIAPYGDTSFPNYWDKRA